MFQIGWRKLICHNWFSVRSEIYHFVFFYGVRGIRFNFITFIFSCYFCSIDLKKQSKHSGLCPDTSSLVCYIIRFLLGVKSIAYRGGTGMITPQFWLPNFPKGSPPPFPITLRHPILADKSQNFLKVPLAPI